MPRSREEGSVRRRAPDGEDRRDEQARRQAGHQDLVAALDDHPRDGRAHDRGARRPQARAVFVSESMVGHKLGEFAPTRTFRSHAQRTERSDRSSEVGVDGSEGHRQVRPDHRRGRRGGSSTSSAGSTSRRLDASCGSRRSARATTSRRLLDSAIANAEQQPGVIARTWSCRGCWVDEGPTLKRCRPRALRSCDEDPQAHLAHHAGRSDRWEMTLSGSQGQPVRVPAGGHLPLEVQLVRRQGLRRPAARGRLDPQAHPLDGCRAPASRASTSSARATRSGSSSARPAPAS